MRIRLSPDNIEWGLRTGLDFAREEVRRHHIDICSEMVDRCEQQRRFHPAACCALASLTSLRAGGVDGIELDFMRHPGVFRIEEAASQGYLLTDMVAAIKAAVDAAALRSGRTIELVVRVPPTVYDCHRLGIEISRWISDGLVDVVVAGEGWIAHT